jgi:hypothetical protein
VEGKKEFAKKKEWTGDTAFVKQIVSVVFE